MLSIRRTMIFFTMLILLSACATNPSSVRKNQNDSILWGHFLLYFK